MAMSTCRRLEGTVVKHPGNTLNDLLHGVGLTERQCTEMHPPLLSLGAPLRRLCYSGSVQFNRRNSAATIRRAFTASLSCRSSTYPRDSSVGRKSSFEELTNPISTGFGRVWSLEIFRAESPGYDSLG